MVTQLRSTLRIFISHSSKDRRFTDDLTELLRLQYLESWSSPRDIPAGEWEKAIYKGLGCLANPLFGTTSMHAAALFQKLGDKEAKKFIEDLRENETQILSSNGEVRRLVSAGKFAFGLTDTDDAVEAIRDKKPVKMVFPDEEPGGMGMECHIRARDVLEVNCERGLRRAPWCTPAAGG